MLQYVLTQLAEGEFISVLRSAVVMATVLQCGAGATAGSVDHGGVGSCSRRTAALYTQRIAVSTTC